MANPLKDDVAYSRRASVEIDDVKTLNSSTQ